MADRCVAMNATDRFVSDVSVAEDVVTDTSVTFNAVLVQNPRTHGPDANRLVKILQRKPLRVPEAVLCFDKILGYKRVRRVAVVAGCYRVVTRLLPAVVLIPHNMAVDARLWIAAEIREPLGITDCVAARSTGDPQQEAEHESRNADATPPALASRLAGF